MGEASGGDATVRLGVRGAGWRVQCWVGVRRGMCGVKGWEVSTPGGGGDVFGGSKGIGGYGPTHFLAGLFAPSALAPDFAT